MQIPANMTAPRPQLADGETSLHAVGGLRRKGIFGNRYGDLHVTDRRVLFVKAIMRGPIAAAFTAKGVKPMLAFDRAGLTVTKVALKKQTALELTSNGVAERIVLEPAEVDAVLAMLT